MSQFGGVPAPASTGSKFGGKPVDAAPPDAAPEKVSQELGFEKSLLQAFDNLASGAKWVANQGIFPFAPGAGDVVENIGKAAGLPSGTETEAGHKEYIAKRSATEGRPGGIGQFAGGVAAGLPLAGFGLGPATLGGLTAALTTTATSPAGVAGEAALGATLGKGFDYAGRGLKYALRSQPVKTATDKAVDYVTGLMEKTKKTGADFASYARQTFGKPVTAAEALGRPGKAQLTALGRRSGQTPDKLEAALAARKEGARQRIEDDFARQLGVPPDAAQGKMDDVLNAGRAAAAPLYKAAFARPEASATWSPRIQEFLDQPETRAGLARGLQIQRLEAVTKGEPFNPSDYSVVFQKDGSPLIVSKTIDFKGAPKQIDAPNLRTIDAIKRGLDAMVNDHRNPLTGRLNMQDEKTRALVDFTKAFIAEVDKVAPKEYGAARKVASDYLSAQTAYDQGQKALFSTKLTEKQFAKMFAEKTPVEQNALRGGIANNLWNMAQNGRLKASTFDTPRMQAKLATAFGPDRARAFAQRLRVEAEMAKSGARMAPGTNSVTAEALMGAGEQDAGHLDAAMHGAHAVKHLFTGNALAALHSTIRAFQKTGAWAKTAGMPEDVRDEVGKMLMMPPLELARFLKTQPIAEDPASLTALMSLIDKARAGAGIASGSAVTSGQ